MSELPLGGLTGAAEFSAPSRFEELRVSLTPQVVTLDPVSRIEGHLKVEVAIEKVQGQFTVVDAWSTGTAFRGIEAILVNRHPWDAVPITQRICGVCPVSHGLAATLAIEQASGVTPPDSARLLRNLVLGANYLQSHILHFYQLAVLDFVAGPGLPPWQPAWTSDLRLDPATTNTLVGHYVQALAMRRKAHEMGAVFGGRLPHPPTYVPGGFTARPSAARKATFAAYLSELAAWIESVYIPDIELLGAAYGDYFTIGRGTGNLLAYGAFDLDAAGATKLFARGRVEAGDTVVQTVDVNAITESTAHSWYAPATDNLPPALGSTVAQCPRPGAYSWLKAPRYNQQPYEAGPLARMWVNGDYRRGISVLDRHLARGYEALKIAQAMQGWIAALPDSAATYTPNMPPTAGTGVGLTEASRGALGHWLTIANGIIARFQVITPTCWNASPRDGAGARGPIEQALLGTPVLDIDQPIEVLRVIHSYDPCLSCAVHVLDGDGQPLAVLRAG